MQKGSFHFVRIFGLAIGLAVFCAATGPALAQICAPEQECGDVDASGAVNVSDALSVLRRAVGQPEALICQCGEEPVCGNGVVEGGEDCDVGTLNGKTCSSLGFAGGALACGAGCTFTTSGCYAERFVALGYGAVVDNATKLLWEMKRSFGGGAADPHDVDNLYAWSSTPGGTEPDGTLFTDFLGKLNNDCTISGPNDSLADSFARTCDWRLPTVAELRTILLAECPGNTSPCIDPVFGLTDAATPYWTAMTVGASPATAVVVSFGDGARTEVSKSSSARVRAVRGDWRRARAVGAIACSGTDCAAGSICTDQFGSAFGYCAKLCDKLEIGVQGSCADGRLCSDVDPGPGVTAACGL